ncbi:MAG: hypothetical protein QNJ94_10355 [Alphaproteobacteria bacterium]|nr:hypothetical protein [Alphaproteobacteria bacterium]
MVKAGLVDEAARQRFGIHALRHAAISLWIEPGTFQKKVQTWAGHAKIQFTMDVYGHLWAEEAGDAAIANKVERCVLS